MRVIGFTDRSEMKFQEPMFLTHTLKVTRTTRTIQMIRTMNKIPVVTKIYVSRHFTRTWSTSLQIAAHLFKVGQPSDQRSTRTNNETQRRAPRLRPTTQVFQV